MRLYTTVNKNTFLNRIIFNSAINANLNIEDFNDSVTSEMVEYFENFLVYHNKEYMIDNCVCAFTTPTFNGNQLDKDEVVISFEADEKDVMLLDYAKFLDYADALDAVTLGAIEEEEEYEKIKETLKDYHSNVSKIDNYYEAIAVVENIPAYAIKHVAISNDSDLVNIIKNNKNKVERHIPVKIENYISLTNVLNKIGYFKENTPENKMKNFAHVADRKWIEGPENGL